VGGCCATHSAGGIGFAFRPFAAFDVERVMNAIQHAVALNAPVVGHAQPACAPPRAESSPPPAGSTRVRFLISTHPAPRATSASWIARNEALYHVGGNARVARRRVQFVVTQQRLDDSDIGTAIEQMSCKAVPKRVQRHGLLDSGRIGRFVEQAAQLAGAHRLAALGTWKQPTFLRRRSGIMTRWAHLPPLAQQVERLGRQHDVAVLASLGLLHPDDLLCAVDVLDLEPDHLAGTQAAAIAETEQYAHLEAAGDREQAARLVLCRFSDVAPGKVQGGRMM
jgi:hypothetical protein